MPFKNIGKCLRCQRHRRLNAQSYCNRCARFLRRNKPIAVWRRNPRQ